MTEAEWLVCENPLAPLVFVAARATDRKRRLFLCACCARVLGGATFAAAWFALTLTSLGVLLTVPLFGAALERRRRHLLRTGALDEDELDDLF